MTGTTPSSPAPSETFRVEPTLDVGLCVDLRMDFFAAMGIVMEPDAAGEMRQANLAYFQQGVGDGSVGVWVAWVGEELAGCVMLQEQRMIPNRAVPTGRTGMVLNVHVLDGFRRRGIGEALMLEVQAEGVRRGLDRLDLKASEMGKALYRRLGWGDPRGGRPMEFSLL